MHYKLIMYHMCLLGAFIPGVPVQPVVLRYPNKLVSPACSVVGNLGHFPLSTLALVQPFRFKNS